jgi:hypothetical protein
LVCSIEEVHDLITKEKNYFDQRDLDGVMNYVICRLLIEIFNLKNDPKYTRYNTADGVLTQVGRALYAEFVSPYEGGKAKENGNALLE